MLHNYLVKRKALKPLRVKLLLLSCLDRYKLPCTFTFAFMCPSDFSGGAGCRDVPCEVTGAVQRSPRVPARSRKPPQGEGCRSRWHRSFCLHPSQGCSGHRLILPKHFCSQIPASQCHNLGNVIFRILIQPFLGLYQTYIIHLENIILCHYDNKYLYYELLIFIWTPSHL